MRVHACMCVCAYGVCVSVYMCVECVRVCVYVLKGMSERVSE